MRLIIPTIMSLLLLNFCSGRIQIHEISRDLSLKKIDNSTINSLSALWNAGEFLFAIDSEGVIYKFDSKVKNISPVKKSNEKIKDKLFSTGNNIVFRNSEKSKIIFINTSDLEIKKTIDPGEKNITGVFKNIYITTSSNNLYVKNIKSGKTIKTIRKKDEKFFNSEIINGKLVTIGENALFIFNPLLKSFDITPLSLKCSSPFIFSGNFIYYGSADRFFIKYSFKKRKIIWKIRLPMKITSNIIKFKKYLVAIPEDNSIYFFTKKGSIYWWKKLDSEILSPPIKMKNNIAVHLTDRDMEKIVFLNPIKRTKQTLKLKDITLETTPVFFNGYLYSIANKNIDGTKTLYRIGNKTGGIINIKKSKKFEIGRSIKIEVKPVNMINPNIRIIISDLSGNKIIDKNFISQMPVNIAWVPHKEGTFKIQVTLTDENITINEDDIKIEVMDLKRIYREYYLKLIDNCRIH